MKQVTVTLSTQKNYKNPQIEFSPPDAPQVTTVHCDNVGHYREWEDRVRGVQNDAGPAG